MKQQRPYQLINRTNQEYTTLEFGEIVGTIILKTLDGHYFNRIDVTAESASMWPAGSPLVFEVWPTKIVPVYR